jgi:hypothetical protein
VLDPSDQLTYCGCFSVQGARGLQGRQAGILAQQLCRHRTRPSRRQRALGSDD